MFLSIMNRHTAPLNTNIIKLSIKQIITLELSITLFLQTKDPSTEGLCEGHRTEWHSKEGKVRVLPSRSMPATLQPDLLSREKSLQKMTKVLGLFLMEVP